MWLPSLRLRLPALRRLRLWRLLRIVGTLPLVLVSSAHFRLRSTNTSADGRALLDPATSVLFAALSA
jgi:hypothetical protein